MTIPPATLEANPVSSEYSQPRIELAVFVEEHCPSLLAECREAQRMREALRQCKNLTTNQELSPSTVRFVGLEVRKIVDAALSPSPGTAPPKEPPNGTD